MKSPMGMSTTSAMVTPHGDGANATRSARFFAPARINLLGEHTDYTGGFVLPLAIGFATVAEISARNDGRCSFASTRFPEKFETTLDDRSPARGAWSDYP